MLVSSGQRKAVRRVPETRFGQKPQSVYVKMDGNGAEMSKVIVLQRAAKPILQRPLQRRPGRTTPPEVVCFCHGHDLQLSVALACLPK